MLGKQDLKSPAIIIGAMACLFILGCDIDYWTPVASIIPDESADQASLSRMSSLDVLPVLRPLLYHQQSSRQRPDEPQPDGGLIGYLLPQLWAFGWPENYDANHFVCLGRNTLLQDHSLMPYVFDLEGCPEDYVQGAVMARYEGSGIFTRFWMTQLSALVGFFRDEVLRIYVDDNPDPLYQVLLSQVYNGEAGEVFAHPFGAESKMFITWNYPTVFNEKLIVALDRLGQPLDAYYFQVNAVMDEEPVTRTVPFHRLEQRDEVTTFLLQENVFNEEQADHVISLKGKSCRQLSIEGPATIKAFSVVFPESAWQYHQETLENIDIYIHWDDQATASVALKLFDLFSATQSLPTHSSKALTVTPLSGNHLALTLNLPMPFICQAVINITASEIIDTDLNIHVTVDEGALPSGEWGYFSTHFSETPVPAPIPYHPIFDVTGEGRLAGVCAQMQGQTSLKNGSALPFNYLEGDEIGIIDGLPKILGTGTEDYFNSSFYFMDSDQATPFAQVWGKNDDSANNQQDISACRWHLFNDAVDYQQGITLKVEIGALRPDALKRYRTTAYYYQMTNKPKCFKSGNHVR